MKSKRAPKWLLGLSMPFIATACAVDPFSAGWQDGSHQTGAREPRTNLRDAGDPSEHEQAARDAKIDTELPGIAMADCFRSAIYYPPPPNRRTPGLWT